MDIKLQLATDSKIITSLFQYYIYDMSEYAKFSPDENGSYAVSDTVSKLSDYWKLPEHYPYLITVDGEIAGFSLLRRFPFNKNYFDIGQFFILRKYKNKGVGKKAFQLSVRKHPGKWITRVLLNNTGAYNFWLNVISEISSENQKILKEKYYDNIMYFFYYDVENPG
jgi:predicted acetyltransferase